jgi:hypothetical protein
LLDVEGVGLSTWTDVLNFLSEFLVVLSIFQIKHKCVMEVITYFGELFIIIIILKA